MKNTLPKTLENTLAGILVNYRFQLLEYWPEIYNTYKDELNPHFYQYLDMVDDEFKEFNEANSFKYFIDLLDLTFDPYAVDPNFSIFGDQGILLSGIVKVILSKIDK
jgi:hypothetical protein